MTKLEQKLHDLGYIEESCAKGIWKKDIFGLYIQFTINEEKITSFHLSTYGIRNNVNDLSYTLLTLQHEIINLEEFIDD